MFEFGKALDVGIRRKGKKNQDNLCIIKALTGHPLVVVADGMGGYRGGAEASQIVINVFRAAYRKHKAAAPMADVLREAAIAAYQEIVARSRSQEEFNKMGSTVVAAAIHGSTGKVTVVNVGDSRAYLINKHSIQVISHDHSEVAELQRKGVLSAREAQDYARKNVLTMSLTASRSENLIEPFLAAVDFPKGSILLLCSDGLWGSVPESLIHATALEYSPRKAAKQLVKLANASGGPDNISVIIVRRKGEWKQYKKKHSIDREDTF